MHFRTSHLLRRAGTVALLALVIGWFSGCIRFQAPERRPLILISLDGFRWDYLQRYQPPNLSQLLAQGVKARALIPVFPTKTFPNHYTIVTGLYPEHHGIIANRMYDPEMNAYFRLSDRAAVTDGRWYGGEPIWVSAEKQGLVTGTYFWPGSEAAIQGIRPTYWKAYDESIPNRQRVEEVLDWLQLDPDRRPWLATLYFSDVDTWGHKAGPESEQVARAVMRVDSAIGWLVAGLKASNWWGKVNLIVVSDHGMASLSPNRVIFLDDYIDVNRVEILDWSPVLAIWGEKSQLLPIYQKLKNAHPHLHVYWKEEIPARLHFRDHPRIPPLIGIADVGYAITTRDYFSRHRSHFTGGDHGYDNNNPAMRGIFIAVGPDFPRHREVPPFSNIHLYELFCSVLKIPAAPNDGNPDSLRIVLKPDM